MKKTNRKRKLSDSMLTASSVLKEYRFIPRTKFSDEIYEISERRYQESLEYEKRLKQNNNKADDKDEIIAPEE